MSTPNAEYGAPQWRIDFADGWTTASWGTESETAALADAVTVWRSHHTGDVPPAVVTRLPDDRAHIDGSVCDG